MNASPSSSDPWIIFDYEVDMFRNLCQLLTAGNPQYQSPSQYIKNAIVESAVLHTRILVDVLLSRGSEQDDIQLSRLAPTFTCSEIDLLRRSYGNRKKPDSPCWAFNKMLAHLYRHTIPSSLPQRLQQVEATSPQRLLAEASSDERQSSTIRPVLKTRRSLEDSALPNGAWKRELSKPVATRTLSR